MTRDSRKRRAAPPAPSGAPAPERLQHDKITLMRDTILDDHGVISQPYRVTGKLDAMLDRGDITAAMRDAGQRFWQYYRLAAQGTVRAADWQGEIRGGHDSMSLTTLQAREARDRAMAALGHTTPCGRCAWFVIGEEMTLREWALREGWNGRPLSNETAKGILIGALGALAAHFRM